MHSDASSTTVHPVVPRVNSGYGRFRFNSTLECTRTFNWSGILAEVNCMPMYTFVSIGTHNSYKRMSWLCSHGVVHMKSLCENHGRLTDQLLAGHTNFELDLHGQKTFAGNIVWNVYHLGVIDRRSHYDRLDEYLMELKLFMDVFPDWAPIMLIIDFKNEETFPEFCTKEYMMDFHGVVQRYLPDEYILKPRDILGSFDEFMDIRSSFLIKGRPVIGAIRGTVQIMLWGYNEANVACQSFLRYGLDYGSSMNYFFFRVDSMFMPDNLFLDHGIILHQNEFKDAKRIGFVNRCRTSFGDPRLKDAKYTCAMLSYPVDPDNNTVYDLYAGMGFNQTLTDAYIRNKGV